MVGLGRTGYYEFDDQYKQIANTATDFYKY